MVQTNLSADAEGKPTETGDSCYTAFRCQQRQEQQQRTSLYNMCCYAAGGSSAPGACRDAVRAAPALSLPTALASVPAGTAGPGGTAASQAPNAGMGCHRPAYVARAPVRLRGWKDVKLRSGRIVLKALLRSSCGWEGGEGRAG